MLEHTTMEYYLYCTSCLFWSLLPKVEVIHVEQHLVRCFSLRYNLSESAP